MEHSAQHFLDLIGHARRGKFKIYIGMTAGVGKSYCMLQELQGLIGRGVDARIGYIETHGRAGTAKMVEGLLCIPRRKVCACGIELEEMDLDVILREHPEVVLVDELAHTNADGSKNEKRWQDVLDMLDAGINVISAINIQHIESLNQYIESITGIKVAERVPDKMLVVADEVVNIDLTADELITRLKQGMIYNTEKVEILPNNFLPPACILQLRELAILLSNSFCGQSDDSEKACQRIRTPYTLERC